MASLTLQQGEWLASFDSRHVNPRAMSLENERPDVNYLQVFRDAKWGKRDTWAWFFGMWGALTLASIPLLSSF